MADGSLLKEILDSLHDVDSINFFAAANGLTGEDEVENRLKEVHIDNLWEELLLDLGPDFKKPRHSFDIEGPSTSIQSGGRDEKEEKPYFIWRRIPGSSGKTWPVTRHSKSSSMSNGGGIN